MSADTIGTQRVDRGGRHGSGWVEEGGKLSGGEGLRRREITEEDFHRLHPKLVATFRKSGASAEQARDLSQETLLRAHRGLGAFQGRSEFDTWVVSIAKKVWLQHRRNQSRQRRKAEEVPLEAIQWESEQVAWAQNPEDRMVARDLLAQVRRAIERLPETMRKALILCVCGHKYREIAVLLGIPENRASDLIHQARKKLRREALEQPADSAP